MRLFTKRFWLLFSLPVAVLIIGTFGFVILEDLSVMDAFYFTLVTVSTVGYGDITPTTLGSKLFGILLIIFGIGSFLTIVTTMTQVLVQSGQDRIRRQRLNILIGVFFTEMGNRLLNMFTRFDANIENIRGDFALDADWTEPKFGVLTEKLDAYHYSISADLMDLDELHKFLKDNGDLLMRQLENTDLLEHESFTELLWAVTHLRDELIAREKLVDLPSTDRAHLANDVRRVYVLLTRQWLEYMRHLKTHYPYLFSLALRTNPFVIAPAVIIRQ